MVPHLSDSLNIPRNVIMDDMVTVETGKRSISYEEMLEMASLGAKVMQPHSIQDARLNRVDIEVRSSFTDNEGTLITKRKNIFRNF